MIEPDEIAALLKCTVETVFNELRAGSLPGVKPGREWVIPRQAFFDHINLRAGAEAAARRSGLVGIAAHAANDVQPVLKRRRKLAAISP